MAPTMHVPRGEERRAHPRHPHRRPLAIQPVGRGLIAAESIDVSIGGMRVRSSSRVPLGACDVVLSADADDRLVVRASVVEEVIDASTGEVTARVVFDAGVRDHAEQIGLSADRETLVARRRGLAVVAAGLVAVVAVGQLVLSDGAGPVAKPDASVASAPVSDREASTTSAAEPAPTVATTVAAPMQSAPPATPATSPATDASVAPTTTGAAPAPTAVQTATRSESADNALSVILGTSPEDTAVSSSMGPSQGVDHVRVQLHVTPEPDGTALPVGVTVENRGTETLRFPDGLQAVISATRDGAVVAATTLTGAAITEVAPGQLVSVEGMLDFGATGEYDVAAQVDVSG